MTLTFHLHTKVKENERKQMKKTLNMASWESGQRELTRERKRTQPLPPPPPPLLPPDLERHLCAGSATTLNSLLNTHNVVKTGEGLSASPSPPPSTPPLLHRPPHRESNTNSLHQTSVQYKHECNKPQCEIIFFFFLFFSYRAWEKKFNMLEIERKKSVLDILLPKHVLRREYS